MNTQGSLAADLRGLGLREGDWVVVHSSMRSLGHVEGGPQAVIDAFLEVLGPRGLLMVPTFTFTNFTPFFDPRRTPSQMGLITETLRRRPESVRSWHPRHSVAAVGRAARWATAGHLTAGSVGKGSPLDKLARQGGYVLLLGVDQNVNTTIHVAEVHAELPYLDVVKDSPDFPETARVRLPTGEMVQVRLAPYPTCSEGFGKLAPHLEREGKLRRGRVGQAPVQLMRARDVVDVGAHLLRRDPLALLCDRPRCYPCTEKRRFMAHRAKRGSRGLAAAGRSRRPRSLAP
ncbi:MAG: AAC(3) family N-acetyltransferase [Candidatus Bipolaricaulaceae bacterium]